VAWFRRRHDEPDAADAADAAPADVEPPPFVGARDDRPTPGDWMAMPPMARTVGPAPTRLGNVQRLADMMTTRRPLALTGTLGHHVSPLAPAGSVEGLAAAVRAPAGVRGGADGGAGVGGARDLPLREPVVQREAAVTTSTSPSLPAITEARLPQAPPTRVLAEPSPLPTADIGAANEPPPLRVVERGARRVAPPAAPVVDVVDEADDAPIGGTPLQPTAAPPMAERDEPDATTTTDGTVVDLPLVAPADPFSRADAPADVDPGELMPPIQPRAVQRRALEAATPPAATRPAADLPLPPRPDWAQPPSMPLQQPTVQRQAIPDVAADADDAHGDATAPLTGDAPPLPVTEAHDAGGAPMDAVDGIDLPLRATAPAAAPGAHEDEGPPPDRWNAPSDQRPSDRVAEPEPAVGVQRSVDPDDDADADAGAVAPLLGDRPLHALAQADGDGSQPAPRTATGETLPLAQTPATGPTLATPPAPPSAPQGSSVDSSAAGGAVGGMQGASTVGGSAVGAAVQRHTVGGIAHSGPAAVQRDIGNAPLAGGVAHSGPAAVQRDVGNAPLAGSVAHSGPAAVQRDTVGGIAHGGAAAVQRDVGNAPLAGGVAPMSSVRRGPVSAPAGTVRREIGDATLAHGPASVPTAVVQRDIGSAAPLAHAVAPTAMQGGASTVQQDIDSAPLAHAVTPSSTVQRDIGAAPLAHAVVPNSVVQRKASAAATATARGPGLALPLRSLPSVQERPAASPGVGGPLTEPLPVTAPLVSAPPPVPSGSAMPLQAPVQRSADGSGTGIGSNNQGNGAAATHGPGTAATIGDMAVANGIATRQPDGSVLFTRQEPPPSTNGSLPIQRVQTEANDASQHIGSDGAAAAGHDTAAAQTDLETLARKLFPSFRRLLAEEVRTSRGRVANTPWNRH
jgi:hypothetical protein